jgi:hypothetical protein
VEDFSLSASYGVIRKTEVHQHHFGSLGVLKNAFTFPDSPQPLSVPLSSIDEDDDESLLEELSFDSPPQTEPPRPTDFGERDERNKHSSSSSTLSPHGHSNYQEYFGVLDSENFWLPFECPILEEMCIGHYWQWTGSIWTCVFQSWVRTNIDGRNHASVVLRDRHMNIIKAEYLTFDTASKILESLPSPLTLEQPQSFRLAPVERNWLAEAFAFPMTGEVPQMKFTVSLPFFGLEGSLMSFFSGSMSSQDTETQKHITENVEALNKEGYSTMEAFRWCVNNWRNIHDSPIFKHLGNLLSIAIVLGFAPPDWSDIHCNSIRVFRLTALDKFIDMASLLDGFIMALNYFVESVIASWEEGSLMPFMYEKTMSRTLDVAFERVRHIIPHLATGEFVAGGGNWSVLMSHISEALSLYKIAIDTAPAGTWQRKIFSDRYVQLQTWQFEVALSRKAGKLVKQPFGIVFFGDPGCGKSGLMVMTAKIRSAIAGIDYDAYHVANITPDDAYDSQVTNSTLHVFFNDVANRPLKLDPSLGIAKALSMCDNIGYVATKAELELKGKVCPELLTVIGSTNNRTMHMEQLSCCSDSLRRRLKLVDVAVKPQYKNDIGGIDTEKFLANPCKKIINGGEVDAPYLLTINVVSDGGYMPMKWYDKELGVYVSLSNMEIDTFAYYLERIILMHEEAQTEHVARLNTETFCKCKTCGFAICCCPATPLSSDDEVESIDDPTEQKQGYAKTKAAIQSGFRKALFGHLGILPEIFDYFSRDRHLSNAATLAIDILSESDVTQWWYWISPKLWESKIIKKLAPVLLDVDLRKRYSRQRFWNRLSFGIWVGGMITMIFCPPIETYNRVVPTLITNRPLVGMFFRYFLPDYTIMKEVKSLIPQFPIRGVYCFLINHMIVANFTLWFYTSTQLLLLRRTAYDILSRRRNAVSEIAQSHRTQYGFLVKTLLAGIGALGTGFAFFKLYQAACPDGFSFGFGKDKAALEAEASAEAAVLTDPQVERQNFLAVTEEELVKKNAVREIWTNKIVKQQCGIRNLGMTADQLGAVACKNLSTIEYQDADGNWCFISDVSWLRTDLAIIPAHSVPRKPEMWRFAEGPDISRRKVCCISPSNFVRLTGADCAFLHVSYRSMKNLIPFLDHNPGRLKAKYYHRGLDGNIISHDVVGEQAISSTGARVIDWKWPCETFQGACGGVYVTTGVNPSIVGYHYAGILENLTIGRSFLPSAQDIDSYVRKLHDERHVLLAADDPPTWSPLINGAPLFDSTASPPPNGLLQEVEWRRGQIDGEVKQGAIFKGIRSRQAFYKSRVTPTIIAEDIAPLCPELEFGSPRFGRSMWSKSAVHSFNCSPGLPESDVRWASQDYLSAYRTLPPHLAEYARPLTWQETVNGIDGVRFIDSMNFSTSMGLGFEGGKRSWTTTYLDEKGIERKDFLPEVWAEVERSMTCLKAGVRPAWVYNATPKDEPTPLTKEKVRLFQVCSIASTLIMRKYFTPILRIIQMTTALSECAVGINAVSPDWEELMRHLETYANSFDGDYSKYDLRMASQLSMASLRVMCEIALLGNYTADDLFIMEMVSSEVIYPLVNYNGQVYLMDGTTPSGTSITVVLNSIDNSLINRSCYVDTFPRACVGDYRKYVKTATFGDDFINSVSGWRTSFNFLAMQKYLADHDMVLTPGLKESVGKRFVSDPSALVFLQRKSNKIPELPYRVGALSEKSIFKSLLSVLSSPNLTPAEAAVFNVDGALREWVYHGEKVYETRRAQMLPILKKHGLAHLSSVAHLDHSSLLRILKMDQVLPLDKAE